MLLWAALMLLAAAGTPRAVALEVWTPQSGEVDLEELPRDAPEARFRHACALVAAGQGKSALPLLRRLLEENPNAEFAESARYTTGMALLSAGEYQEAFDEMDAFLAHYPDSSFAVDARDLQLEAAGNQIGSDVEAGVALFDRLAAAAPAEAVGARARYQKEKADALLRHGRYLWAKAEYTALRDLSPGNELVMYSFVKEAECDLQLSQWLGRGDEYLKRARRTLSDFVAVYPEHELTEEAKEKLAQTQALEAEHNKGIALFYIKCKKRPGAARNYLLYIMHEFPETEDARWAERTLEEILKAEGTPLLGSIQKSELPGASAAEKPESEGAD